MADNSITEGEFFSTVELRAKPGEVEALVEIGRRFVTACRQSEPGLKAIRFHQSVDDPAVFLVYETFENEAAFKAHFETRHFKTIIESELVPKVSKRERVTYRSL